MALYSVASVDDRRIDESNGQLQYRVVWESAGPAVHRSWEPRVALSASASEAVQRIDQAASEEVEAEITSWRAWRQWNRPPVTADANAPVIEALTPTSSKPAETRKRTRSDSSGGTHPLSVAEALNAPGVEVLSALVWRCPTGTSATPPASSSLALNGGGLGVLLGEVMLSEAVAAALHHPASPTGTGAVSGNGVHRRRRQQARTPSSFAQSQDPVSCAAALTLDGHWHAQHTHDLLRSCMVSRAMTPLQPHTRTPRLVPGTRGEREGGEDACVERVIVSAPCSMLTCRARRLEAERGGDGLTIVGIAPTDETRAGVSFASPVSFRPWIGTEACEDLRTSASTEAPHLTAAASEVVGPHTEQLVVRYRCARALGHFIKATADGARTSAGHPRADEVTTAMPLSVFRVAFPQLLIDYLLAHTVVLHGEAKPTQEEMSSSV